MAFIACLYTNIVQRVLGANPASVPLQVIFGLLVYDRVGGVAAVYVLKRTRQNEAWTRAARGCKAYF